MTKNIWVFLLCAILVFITQFNLLQPILQYRLFNYTEDWPFLIYYHTLDLNFLDKMIYVWKNFGQHTSAQLFHIGILSDIFGFNYSAYQVVNVTLKAIGTISFFPLLLVLFKDRKLAFLGTLLFGISSATAGSFLWVVKGSEYLGVMLMNLFLITYYFVIVKNSKKLLILSSILFLISYLMAPPRMFPMLILVPLVEIYWLFKECKFSNIRYSVIRGLVYLAPVILISSQAPVSSCCPFISRPQILLKDLINGNWQNLLDPFSGIGWTLVTNDYFRFFGKLEEATFANLISYLSFLLKGPILIFGIVTLILAPVISTRPKKVFILIFGINFVAQILLFFVANQRFNVPSDLVTPDSPGHFTITKYPAILAIYIFSVSFVSFFEWRNNRKNNLLRAIWTGPIFSIIFLWPTWIVMGPLINDYFSTHWYFGIPAMGTTLFLAAILIQFYEKLKRRRILRIFALFVIFSITAIFYYTHGKAIAKQYLGINPNKITLQDQAALQKKLISKLELSGRRGDLLVYLDIAEDTVNLRRTKQFYREALSLYQPGYHFGYWVHFRRLGNKGISHGCIEAITDQVALDLKLVLKDGKKGFIHTGYCIGESVEPFTKDSVFYGLDNFYALRIQDGEFIDIKNEVIKDLRI